MDESLKHSWGKLLLAVRAILIGIAILIVGILPWSLLVSVNLQVGSTFPWAVFVELIYLFVLWQYLRGKGMPALTSATRRQYLRANRVEPRLLAWSLVAGVLLASGLLALRIVGWLLVSVPPTALEEFALLANYPAWTVIPLLLMGALVAGVVEEAAFRGYMQVPLEQRYDPTTAIWVVTVIFALAHLPSPLALVGFVLGGLGWGYLAYFADSILPGVVIHALADAAVWLWVWQDRQTVERILMTDALQGDSGGLFLVAAGLTFAAGLAALFAFGKLAEVKRMEGRPTV